jgi:hypothetical protein
MRTERLLLLCSFSLSLAACSGEPTERELAAALSANVNAANLQASALVGGDARAQNIVSSMRMEIADVRKLGCTSEGTIMLWTEETCGEFEMFGEYAVIGF